jgi:hypothetical protein
VSPDPEDAANAAQDAAESTPEKLDERAAAPGAEGHSVGEASKPLKDIPELPGMGAGTSPFEAVVPVFLFIGLNRLFGLSWAIAGATAWSLKVAYSRKRKGISIGKFLPIVTVGIIARGVVGIITDSEAVYFGIGIASKAALGLALIGSALIGRNLIANYAPLLFGFDERTRAHPIYHKAMDRVAWIAGIAELISAAFDVWLFNNSSVDGYLTIRFLVNWPFTTAVMMISVLYLSRQLDKIPGFPGMNQLLDARMSAYENALKARKANK